MAEQAEGSKARRGFGGHHRAKEACMKCRLRKVRCDYDLLGAPCTNCLHFNVQCTFYPKKTILKKKNRYASPRYYALEDVIASVLKGL